MRLAILVGLLWFMGIGSVEAAVTDWPVVGQVSRVAICVVKGGAGIVGSLLSHLSAWGAEVIQTVGHCALNTVSNTEEVAAGAVTLTVPTPATTEVVHE